MDNKTAPDVVESGIWRRLNRTDQIRDYSLMASETEVSHSWDRWCEIVVSLASEVLKENRE